MCELMGMSFAKPVSADFSIGEFAKRDEQNADGDLRATAPTKDCLGIVW